MQNINTLIKSYRKSNKLSTQSLADKLGKSTGLINNLENSKSDVFNIELLSHIIQELQIPLSDVISAILLDISPSTTSDLDIHIEKILLSIKLELSSTLSSYENKEELTKLLIDTLKTQLSIIRDLRKIS